jgi:hypothetical protein
MTCALVFDDAARERASRTCRMTNSATPTTVAATITREGRDVATPTATTATASPRRSGRPTVRRRLA